MDGFEKAARAVEEGQGHKCDAQQSNCRSGQSSNTFSARIWHRITRPFRRRATSGDDCNDSNLPDSQVIDTAQPDTHAQQGLSPCAAPDNGLVIRTLHGSPKGYPNLAAFSDSHENFMLYRRFGYLQSRILLEKQDELRALERQLDSLDDGDLAENLHKLIKREAQGDERKKLLVAIETKFCEYAHVLAAAQQLMSFNKPTSSEQRSAVSYIRNNAPVDPAESAYLRCKEDLITLRPGREYAWLDAMIERCLRCFNCGLVEHIFCSKESKRKSRDPNNVYYCKERIAVCALSIITTMILFLLIVPTYFLFHLANEAETGVLTSREIALCIGILLIFTLLFSAVLTLFTGAKRHEILGAAAAYCAVLVVFFGNQA